MLKDVELAGKMLLEIADGVCQADWEIPMIMNLLYSWGVAFDGVRTSERFLSVLAEWTYTVWRWSECGYSRKEKNLVNEDLKYLNFEKSTPINSGKSERKVYPNEPCPCGSGKKYKNCCRGK